MYNIYSTRRQHFNLIICYHSNSSKSTCHNLIDFHECQSLSSFFPCNVWVQSYGFHIFANLRTFSRWESKFSLWGFLQSSGPSSNIPPHISCKENVAMNQLHVSNKNSREIKLSSGSTVTYSAKITRKIFLFFNDMGESTLQTKVDTEVRKSLWNLLAKEVKQFKVKTPGCSSQFISDPANFFPIKND